MAIYLDYAATTPVDQRVADKMLVCLTASGAFGNPASNTHQFGWEAEKKIALSRQHVANIIGASSKEIIWTSGATESNNLAIKGIAQLNEKAGKHIITSKTEHRAVLDTCAFLQKYGFDVTYLDPNSNGVITLASVQEAVRDDTILISLMYVNNETGVINDIARIGKFACSKKILFHVDGAQAIGKVDVDVNNDCIDVLSLASHKVYGPKGIGALYVRRKPRVKLQAQIHGGGHERGFRSGTLATHQIVGMGEAYRLADSYFADDAQHIKHVSDLFWKGISQLPGLSINAVDAHRVNNILNVHIADIESDAFIHALPEVAVSAGSACSSGSMSPSHVLSAMGLSEEKANSSIRFSFGRMTTIKDAQKAAALVTDTVIRLRQSPSLIGRSTLSSHITH